MSQPLDTEDCVSERSNSIPDTQAITQLPLEISQASGPSQASSSPSVFVQLRTSPRKRQSVGDSVAENEKKKTKTDEEVSVEVQHSQTLFESPELDETQGKEVKPTDSQDETPTAMKESSHSHDSQSSEKRKKQKQKLLPDGRVITYAEVRVCYYDEHGALVHTEFDEGESYSTQCSSGYLADTNSSGTSSGTSHTSQDLKLKAHRSAEDQLFVSPRIPQLKKTNSLPLGTQSKSTTSLPCLPTNHNKALVGQQRRHILQAVNGNRKTGQPSSPTLSQPASANCSAFSSILADGTSMDIQSASPSKTSKLGTSHVNISGMSSIHADFTLDQTEQLATADTEPLPQTPDKRKSKVGSKATKLVRRRRKRKKHSASATGELLANKTGVVSKKRRQSSEESLPKSVHPYGRSARNLPAPHHNELVVGARVIAKWSDNHYYIGMAVEKHGNTWRVLFDDGNNGMVNSRDMLVVNEIPNKIAILAKTPSSDEFHPAIIVDHEDNNYLVSFINDASNEPCQVSSVDICLDSEKFTNLKTVLKSCLSTTTDAEVTEKQPDASQTRKVRFDPKATPSTSTPVAQKPTSSVSAKYRKLYTDVQRSPVKAARKTSNEIAATSACALKFGQTASTDLDVYKGFVFMVTSLSNDKIVNEVMDGLGVVDDENSSQSQGADTSDLETVDAETLCAKIEALGGLVIDKYDADVFAAAKRGFLISTGFRRTVKYLQCLAANIPPVSHSWIEYCFSQKDFHEEKNFLLPAGIDDQGKIIEWGTRTVTKPTPLAGVSILLSTKDPGSTFVEDWSSILTIAGAIIVKKISVTSGIKPEYVMTNSAGCTKTHQNQAVRLDIPIVDTEWAIQRLIKGTKET